MAQHISRKELKKDEVRETLAHGAEAVFSHQRATGIILGVAALVLVAVFGWRFYSERQTLKASAAFDAAMKTYDARIRAAGEASEPNEVTYVEEKNKYQDAAKKFSEVAAKYPRTRPGQLARYYTALSQIRLNQFDEAQKNLTALESGSSDEFASLARFQLAGIYERTGKAEEAAKLYRQLADKPTALVPKPTALLALADALRKSNPQEATKVYEQIKKDFPDTPSAEEAQKQLDTLGPKT